MHAPWNKAARQVSDDTVSSESSENSATSSTKPRTSVRSSFMEDKTLQTFSERCMNVFSTILVCSNVLFVGIKVQINLERAKKGLSDSPWLLAVDVCFALAFILEFLLRMALRGRQLLSKDERGWTLFDLVVISTSILEYTTETQDLSFMRVLRITRVTRLFRVLRGVSYVHQLRLMLASMMSSFISLAWAAGFVAFFLYMVAVFIDTDVTTYVRSAREVDSHVLDLYGSVPITMLSLFMSITGGNDWEYFMIPLQTMSYHFYTFFFVTYMFITVFGIMNVLTGIFCDAASRVQEVDKELVISEQLAQADAVAGEFKELFNMCSVGGGLDMRALDTRLSDPDVVDLLKFMELDVKDASGLFDLLDVDGNGIVDVDEFVSGLMRLKGPARSIDVATLLHQSRRLYVRVVALAKFADDNFAKLDARLSGESTSRRAARMDEAIMHEEERERADASAVLRRQQKLVTNRSNHKNFFF